MFFETLRECNAIVSILDVSYNQIEDDCMEELGIFIQQCQHLKILSLVSNKLTDKGMEVLAAYLHGNVVLSELHLDGNKGILDDPVSNLVEIAKSSHVTWICVRNGLMSNKKVHELDEALRIPIERRDIPIKSKTKSAAKISQ